ncbi:hypothetical protein PMIN01_07039 [Paraphaeosphaeria minitans]|uniref:Uncharacterized protein n=1 Tax=Paraphaeosphaeria minitans TaxID=565426 RepID=A0A9P6GK47_9PLEO|nr:hypothetical protein PMIN01_07039 [Paraphaeosphaeria minitans]
MSLVNTFDDTVVKLEYPPSQVQDVRFHENVDSDIRVSHDEYFETYHGCGRRLATARAGIHQQYSTRAFFESVDDNI